MNKPKIKMIEIESNINPLALNKISTNVSETLGYSVKIIAKTKQVALHLEPNTILATISAFSGIISLVLTAIDRWECDKWTVSKVTKTITDAAIRQTGCSLLSNFRYEGIDDFLKGKIDCCKVFVEIDDEDYYFILSRDGTSICIKLKS